MALDMDKPLDEMTREELLELKRIKSYGQQPAAPAAAVQAQPPSVPSPEIQQTKQQAPIPAAEPPTKPYESGMRPTLEGQGHARYVESPRPIDTRGGFTRDGAPIRPTAGTMQFGPGWSLMDQEGFLQPPPILREPVTREQMNRMRGRPELAEEVGLDVVGRGALNAARSAGEFAFGVPAFLAQLPQHVMKNPVGTVSGATVGPAIHLKGDIEKKGLVESLAQDPLGPIKAALPALGARHMYKKGLPKVERYFADEPGSIAAEPAPPPLDPRMELIEPGVGAPPVDRDWAHTYPSERMATPVEEFDSRFPPDAPDRMRLVPDRAPEIMAPPIESFPEDAVWEQEGLRPRPPAEFGPPDADVGNPVPYSRRMPGPRTEIDPDYYQDTMPSQPIAETVPREGASSAPRRRFPWESERPPDRTWRSGNQGQMQPATKPAVAPKRQAPVKQKAAPPPAPIQPPPQEPLMSGQTDPGEWSAPERPAESQVNSGGKRSLKKEKPQLSREIPIREQAKQDAQAGAARSTRIGDADFTPEERAIYDKAFDYHTKNKSSKPTSAPPEPPFPEAPAQTGAQSDQKLHLWGAQAFRAFVKTGQVPKKFARLKGTPAFDQGWSSAESKAARPK